MTNNILKILVKKWAKFYKEKFLPFLPVTK